MGQQAPSPPQRVALCGGRFGLRPLQIGGGGLSTFGHDLVRDLLSLDQARHARALNRRNMDEHIVAAVGGLDESKALDGIKEFYGTRGHVYGSSQRTSSFAKRR